MLKEVREKILGSRTIPDSRLASLEMVSNQDIINCLNLIDGFGAEFCLEHKIGTIKTLRRFGSMGLKHAKDVVEVLAEACHEGSGLSIENENVAQRLKREMADMFPGLQFVQ